MRIIFLDFDGVLHKATEIVDWPTSGLSLSEFSERLQLFYWAPYLAGLLEAHSEVQIIIHSTWRKQCSVEQMQVLLGPLGPRVLGMTHRGLLRVESITDAIKGHDIQDYLILDDDAGAFPEGTTGLVLCDPLTGVSDPHTLARIEAWLKRA